MSIYCDGLSDAFDHYMYACEVKNLAAATLRGYRQQVLPLLASCRKQGATEVSDVTPDMIRAYMVAGHERGLADQSTRTGYRAYHAFFAFCVQEEIIDRSPMDKIRPPKVDFAPKPAIGPDGVNRLLDACTTARDRALLLFLIATGCRAGEVVRMVGGDIDLAQKKVLVRKTKARTARLVHFSRLTQQALADYYAQRGTPRANEPVWLTETTDTQLTYAGLRQLLRRLGARAGVERSNPHALRRTFAVRSHCKGMSDRDLMKLMGHSTPEMLRHYLPLEDDHIKHIYEEFGPLSDLDLDLPDTGPTPG